MADIGAIAFDVGYRIARAHTQRLRGYVTCASCRDLDARRACAPPSPG